MRRPWPTLGCCTRAKEIVFTVKFESRMASRWAENTLEPKSHNQLDTQQMLAVVVLLLLLLIIIIIIIMKGA
jgi:hypothetical protein